MYGTLDYQGRLSYSHGNLMENAMCKFDWSPGSMLAVAIGVAVSLAVAISQGSGS
jgi:hypothetical protein